MEKFNIDKKIFIEKHTSFPEQAIYYFYKFFLKKKGVFSRYRFLTDKKWFEADVFIASKKIAIEYDGIYWHKDNLEVDKKKRRQLADWGIRVIVIKEDIENKIENDIIFYDCYKNTNKNLSWAINKSAELLGWSEVPFDAEAHTKKIFDMFIKNLYENSFYVMKPKEAREWDYEENGDLKPWDVSVTSAKKVHWKCKRGHKWVAPVYVRSRGNGCFVCHVQKRREKYKSDLPGKFWL